MVYSYSRPFGRLYDSLESLFMSAEGVRQGNLLISQAKGQSK